MLTIRVLGPVEAEVDGVPVDLGGPRQRAVLALLVIGRGGVVSVDRMIEQLWRGEPPPRAIASLQAYVSNLRRLLEPGRAQRSPAKLLVSAPPGYALRLPADAVDAWRFAEAVRRAQGVPPEQTRALLSEALEEWQGPAYAEVADEEWAAAEVARLSELRLVARELLVDATVQAGHAGAAVPPAEVLTREHPLREEGWRLLASALWASGRQADALGALRRARQILADELGLDPGPALADLERAILTRRTDLMPPVAGGSRSGLSSTVLDPRTRNADGVFRDRAPTIEAPASTPTTTTEPALFVGRDAELRAIVDADPTGGVVIVTGEAGAGKSSLLARAREQLTAAGRTVIVGRCPEFAGAPAAWAWVEALRELALRVPPDDPAALSPILDEPAEGNTAAATAATAATGRFRLHRAVVAWLRAAAAGAPLAILLDDLHRADGETLALLEAVTGPGGAPILVVTGHRPTEVGERLAETLAALARRSPRRVPLTGLPPSDVGILVAAVCGRPVDAATVHALAERTGGNPFYVWESARLLASEGALVATSDVPQGVRDVLRRRLARLPQPVVSVLRLAAVVGREADVEVLIDAADIDEDGVLDALEAGLIAGLLTEPAPGRVRFEHALVRDTLYTDLAQLRRGRMHARLAEAIRRTRPDDLSGLAYHYAQAATVATAAQAVEYGLRAAEQAEARYAHDAAVELLQQAVEAFDRLTADGTDRDARLVDLLRRLLQAQIRAGAVLAARETRQQAVAVAQRAGRDDLVVAAFAAWTEPTPWQTRPYATVDRAVVAQLERLIARDDLDRVTRGRLLHAFVAELTCEDDPRVRPAAARELAIAREVGDPALVAAALTSVAQSQQYDRDAEVRPPIATELRELGRAYQMPAYVWLGEHIDGTVAAVRNDPDGVRRHASTGLQLARQYRMGEAEVVNLSSLAMLDHVQGRFDEAERGYAQVREHMVRLGTMHAAGFHALARMTVCFSRQRCEDLEAALSDLHAQVGSPAADVYAYALTLLGRHDEARAVDRSEPVRPDYFHGFFVTARVEAALALGELDRAAALAPHLVPVQDQLAGAASTSIAAWPVALTLGRLHRALGDETAAQEQFARAGQVARAWRSAHWAAEADRLAGREVRSK